MRTSYRNLLKAMIVPVIIVTVMSAARAGTTGGGSNLPWEGPLETLQTSLSGPVAKAISVIAIVIAGASLVFGEDLGQFARRLILIVLAVALIVLASSFLSGLNEGVLI